MWGLLCYVFLSSGLLSSFGGRFTVILFCYVFLLMYRPFSPCGGLFCYIFLHVGAWAFLSSWGIFCPYGFFMGLPPPPMIFLADACYYVICNLHPMSSAITYSGHCVPNKAHCNNVFNSQQQSTNLNQYHVNNFY